MQRNKRVNNVVSSQWREPVETQNLASPEEVCAIYSCYNQRVVIAFPACETQDFTSLLNMLRFLVLCFWGITLYAALFVYASFAPPQYEKSYGA